MTRCDDIELFPFAFGQNGGGIRLTNIVGLLEHEGVAVVWTRWDTSLEIVDRYSPRVPQHMYELTSGCTVRLPVVEHCPEDVQRRFCNGLHYTPGIVQR